MEGAKAGQGEKLGEILSQVRDELREAAALQAARSGSLAHTVGAGLVAIGIGMSGAFGPATDDQGAVIPAVRPINQASPPL